MPSTHLASPQPPFPAVDSGPAPAHADAASLPLHRLRSIPRFGVVMAALLAVATFPQSAVFAVDRIEVIGAASMSPSAIAALAGVQHGQRLFAVPAVQATARLRAYPRIRTANVRVRPPGAVVITVTERLPAIALVAGSRFALLDEQLTLVALSKDPEGLIVVEDRLGRAAPLLRVGSPVASESARLALAALAATPRNLRGEVILLSVAPGPDFTLLVVGNVEIRAGGSRGLAERLAQLPAVLDGLATRGVTPLTVDLRYAGSIVVTPALEDIAEGDGR